MDQMEALETKIAHLIRSVDDLSDVVASQAREIDRLTRITTLLAAREAERDGDQDAPAPNQRPPHW